MIIATFFLGTLLMHTMRSADSAKCNLSNDLLHEIHSHKKIVEEIAKFVVEDGGAFKNLTWTKLAEFVDDFGSRLTGSRSLEDAIDFLHDEFVKQGLENVRLEPVSVPHWVRNEEYAILKKPRGTMKLSMLGLGGSVGTPKNGINASVIVVQSLEELYSIREKVPGKIVVFDSFYLRGCVYKASSLGAVAVFVRATIPISILRHMAKDTPLVSVGTPHAGFLFDQFDSFGKPIPTACISLENSGMLRRLYMRGVPLQVHLYMGAENLPRTTSRNLMGEIPGKQYPEKMVVVSGHIDSWDVGQGAMDDGGGAFASWMSLAVLRRLNLRPKQTVRAILWTGEEQGLYGVKSYVNDHVSEMKNLTLVMESDYGTSSPSGFNFVNGNLKAVCIMEEVLKLMTPFNTTTLDRKSRYAQTDISEFADYDVPLAFLQTRDEKYLWYHHSEGDSMAVLDPLNLDQCTGLFAATSYVIANLETELPRY